MKVVFVNVIIINVMENMFYQYVVKLKDDIIMQNGCEKCFKEDWIKEYCDMCK
jgi:hypothetical protein